jgi:aquaporin Z
MAYAIGHISGVSPQPGRDGGLSAGGRFPTNQIVPHIIAQAIGGVIEATVLYVIASGKAGFAVTGGFASNGYGEHSPGQYSMLACLVADFVLTAVFLFVIMGATHGKATAGFAPLAIGLGLTLIHLISIDVTNTSVNPARSTGVALFAGGWALQQLCLFWIAPNAGGIVGGVTYRLLNLGPSGQIVVLSQLNDWPRSSARGRSTVLETASGSEVQLPCLSSR